MRRRINIAIGDRYGKLTCVAFSHVGKRHRGYSVFRCDCGKEKTVLDWSVISGNTKSCGCLHKDAGEKNRLPNNGASINNLILQYKRHARNRGLVFEIPRDIFIDNLKQNCYYCGLPPSNLKEGMRYSGLDRVNSKLGYVVGNIVPCCKNCNVSKGAMTEAEFLDWIRRVYEHSCAMADQWG